MASKFKSYPPELKKEILEKYHNGQSSNSLATEYGLSRNTITNWVRKKKLGLNYKICSLHQTYQKGYYRYRNSEDYYDYLLNKEIFEASTIVEDWIEFYNTKRLKNRKKPKIFS